MNNTNWRGYVNDPKFLIALLPGLEIARNNLNLEIDSIRAAVNGGGRPAVPEEGAADKPVRLLKGKRVGRRGRRRKAGKADGFVADPGMTQTQFILAVALFHGGTANNAQLRAAAWRNRGSFGSLNEPKRLSVSVAEALKKGLVVRVGKGEIRAVAEAAAAAGEATE